MIALVTGGAGFIGQHTVHALCDQGHEVHVLDANQPCATGWDSVQQRIGDRLYLGDVCDPRAVANLFERVAFDVVLHLAAQSHVDESLLNPVETLRVNALGTHVIADACAKRNVPLVYCSTDEVYGDIDDRNTRGLAWIETDPLAPSSPYSAGKAAGELIVRAMARTIGLRFIITRGSNAFGSGQYTEKLVPIAFSMLQRGERVPLHGGGHQVRQWVHVSEFAEMLCRSAVLLAAGDKAVENVTMNIAGPVRCTVREVVEMIARYLNVPSDQAWRKVPDRPGGDAAYHVSGQLAEHLIEFKARRRLDDVLELKALKHAYPSSGVCNLTTYEETAA